MPKIKDQTRAGEACKAVNDFITTNPGRGDEYKQELQQLPSRILTSGLGQTLAFYASKGGVLKKIGDQIAEFLSAGEKKNVIEYLDYIMQHCTAWEYRQMTRQALSYAEWLKRYAKALVEAKVDERGEVGP
jgi:CRISPR type III-B/RAMP module-associated protein Cmr5